MLAQLARGSVSVGSLLLRAALRMRSTNSAGLAAASAVTSAAAALPTIVRAVPGCDTLRPPPRLRRHQRAHACWHSHALQCQWLVSADL